MKTLCAQVTRALAASWLVAAAVHAAAEPPVDALAPLPPAPDQSTPVPAKAFSSTLQQRLDRRFAEAHAAVRPKWYQAARIEELPPVGDTGVRVSRIVTGLVTYCMTYRQDGKPPTYSLCD